MDNSSNFWLTDWTEDKSKQILSTLLYQITTAEAKVIRVTQHTVIIQTDSIVWTDGVNQPLLYNKQCTVWDFKIEKQYNHFYPQIYM